MAVAPRGGTPAARAAEPPAQDERIDDLLAAVIAGHEGDGLPARLEAVLRRDDAAVHAAAAFVHGGRATKMIIDALAAAGTPAAQDALFALAREGHLPGHVRAEAVASLGLVRRPTEPTMTEVGELIRARDQDLRAPALFLAGTVARAGRAEHPAQAAAIERIVLAEAARARGTDDQLDALAALGNLGRAPPRVRYALFPMRRPIACSPRRCGRTPTRPSGRPQYSQRDSGSSSLWSTRWPKPPRAIRPSSCAPAPRRCWRAGPGARPAWRRATPNAPASEIVPAINCRKRTIFCLLNAAPIDSGIGNPS
jgi:hypothetical protein